MKRKTKRIKDYPPNVPRKLIRLYRQFNQNGLALAKHLGINDAHLSKLFNKGIEPKDNEIRLKMFLKKLKPVRIPGERKPPVPRPEWLQEWNHISKEERQKVIQQYLLWKDNQISSKG